MSKSFKIMSGLRLNIGRKSISTTIGQRGLSTNIGTKGTFINIGVPGTGIRYRRKLFKKPQNNRRIYTQKELTTQCGVFLGLAIGGAVLFLSGSAFWTLLSVILIPILCTIGQEYTKK